MKPILILKFAVLLSLLLVSFACLDPARAQSLAPFRSEYRKQAKGLLTLINDKDIPVHVMLRPESFTSDENGHLKRLPMDESINLVLAQTSLRIPPKETRYVAYEAKPKNLPAWFMIYVTFVPEAEGIVVGTSIPHFAYITAGDPKPGEVVMAARYVAAQQLLRVTFTSTSQQLAHLESIEASGGPQRDLGSISVLPGKSTIIEFKLRGSSHPDSVKASGRKLKLQCPVVVE